MLIALASFTVGFAANLHLIFPQYYKYIEQYNMIVHCGENPYQQFQIRFKVDSYLYQYRDGILIYSYEHPGVVTNIGRNYTAQKLTGANLAWIPAGQYNYNLTAVSMGLDSTTHLSTGSTKLPTESTRVTVPAGNFTYISLARFNMTAYYHPAGTGDMNCSAIQWQTGAGSDNNLFCYDIYTTFSYTGADTIIVIWQVYVNYS